MNENKLKFPILVSDEQGVKTVSPQHAIENIVTERSVRWFPSTFLSGSRHQAVHMFQLKKYRYLVGTRLKREIMLLATDFDIHVHVLRAHSNDW